MHNAIKWTLLVLAILIGAFLFASSITRVVNSRPELQMSQNFLIENTNLLARCGTIKEIHYIEGGSGLSFTSEATRGRYRFNVIGTRSNGEFEVWWEVKKTDTNFIATEIRELYRSGDVAKIWP